MEVTQFNFLNAYSTFSNLISQSVFVSLDAKYTNAKDNSSVLFDFPQDVYTEVCENASFYIPLQIGVSIFVKEESGFVAHPFNFLLYPRGILQNEKLYTCKVGSLMELHNLKFDFNKWIKEGLPLVVANRNPTATRIVPSKRDSEHLQLVNQDIEQWIEDTTSSELILKPSNPYLRKLTYQEIEEKYSTLIHAVPVRQPSPTIKLIKKAEGQTYQKFTPKPDDVPICFKTVMDLLVSHKKPIVGYDCFQDLVHLYCRFISELPYSLEQFKDDFNAKFPVVFDTKLISNTHQAFKSGLERNTTINDVYSLLTQSSFLQVPIKFGKGFDRYENTQLSESGYDAYKSGVSFISMVINSTSDPFSISTISADEKFKVNKLHFENGPHTYCYLDLTGRDKLPDLHNVIYCTGFDRSTTPEELLLHFSKFGSKLKIQWVDFTSVFVHYLTPIDYSSEIFNSNQPFKAFSMEIYRKVYKGRPHLFSPKMLLPEAHNTPNGPSPQATPTSSIPLPTTDPSILPRSILPQENKILKASEENGSLKRPLGENRASKEQLPDPINKKRKIEPPTPTLVGNKFNNIGTPYPVHPTSLNLYQQETQQDKPQTPTLLENRLNNIGTPYPLHSAPLNLALQPKEKQQDTQQEQPKHEQLTKETQQDLSQSPSFLDRCNLM
eukprot:TRINITY_DN5026_c0_g1_i1.p1 TRINITY_DN5026_c0_g1~~TRINITY_DN5026_c0_g1_i1.p1  ORF type:complete len:665 (-),score=127.78 TRINITY_DN5026_c0_g1_i1:952-2946(-)